MTTWSEYNKGQTITPRVNSWDAYNAQAPALEYQAKVKFFEEEAPKGIDKSLYAQLKARGANEKEIKKQLKPTTSAFKEILKSLSPIKPKKMIEAVSRGIKFIRGTTQALATVGLIPGALIGDEDYKAGVKESLRMAKEMILDKDVPFDQGVSQAAQQFLEKTSRRDEQGNFIPTISNVTSLAVLGFFNLFGDPLFEYGLGLRGVKTLKEFAKFKKVGQIKKVLPKGVKFKGAVRELDIPITPDLKIKVQPKTNSIVIKGYKRRFPTQKALPDSQLAKETTDIIMNVREATGMEMVAKLQGDDLILKATEIIKPIAKAKIPQKPIGEGVTKVSKLAFGVEEKAIERKLTEGISGLPEFKQVNLKEQAQLASSLLKTDPELSLRIAKGLEVPPADILPESVFTAVENQAFRKGDVNTIRELARSQLAVEATAMGQRIRALGERKASSAVESIRELAKLRKRTFRGKKKSVTKETNKVVKDIKSNIVKPTRDDWSGFIQSIKC